MGIGIKSIGERVRALFSGGTDESATEIQEWSLADHTGFDGSVADAEVIGSSPQSYVAAAESVGSLFQKQTKLKLADGGIDDPKPDEWYPLAGSLAMLYELREEYGEDSMQTMGRNVPEHVEFPPDLSGVEGALQSIDQAYHHNHRGGDIGSYGFREGGPGEATIVGENPYPCEFDQGLIAGVARKFAESPVSVEEVGDHCRMDGGQRCEYRVEWVQQD